MNHPQIGAERKTVVSVRPRQVFDEVVDRDAEAAGSRKRDR
jgi:hypothetical protein